MSPATPAMSSALKRHRAAITISLAVGVILGVIFTGPPYWFRYLHGSHARTTASITTTSTTTKGVGVIGFSGGCAPFQVYAQNRWEPYGTAIRTEPSVLSKQLGGFDGNHSIAVDGWVHSSKPYQTNTPPWNSDIWFHLADGSGWVSFAGVRAVPTTHDPTGRSKYGGIPAPTQARCQGNAQ